MPRRSIPKYSLHRATRQARVRIDGRRLYLGKHGSPESHARYAQAIFDWQSRQDQAPSDSCASCSSSTLTRSIARRMEHRPEANNTRAALNVLCQLYRADLVTEFGPRKLEKVRDRLIVNGHVRTAINKIVNRIRQAFRWGVSQEIIPPNVHLAMQSLPALKRGRSNAAEANLVLPVPQELINAIEPFVTRPVWAMIQLQRLTGMRPSEVRKMRCGDIDRSSSVWTYTPRFPFRNFAVAILPFLIGVSA